MPESQKIAVAHTSIVEGRGFLNSIDFSEMSIPSFVPTLDTRYRAEFKGKFLDPGDNEKFLKEVKTIVGGLQDVTTQRAVYYALRGAHPEWTYKGEPLGQEFYDHLIGWVMEKTQLMTGHTMQSLGIWPGNRGYIAGDGTISTRIRGKAPLNSKPMMGFDMVDVGVEIETNATKIIHFEKEAGLDQITSNNFPKYIEAIFSTTQGQPTEAGLKFLRMAEDRGMALYAIHDGDPAGMQMHLQYGMSSKNSCYMPDEFYPKLVRPLGFYPSVGESLGLPPESIKDSEDGIFNNIISLANEKMKMFPQLRRYGFGKEVNVLTQQRKKWEFQALNAIHETAPKIYILEALRVHNDIIKYVPPADDIKEAVIDVAHQHALAEVEAEIDRHADRLYEAYLKPQLVAELTKRLAPNITAFDAQVVSAMKNLEDTPSENFREEIKYRLLQNPAFYAIDVLKKLAKEILPVRFSARGSAIFSFNITALTAEVGVSTRAPQARDPITRTALVNFIEGLILKVPADRKRITQRIRQALEQRFGAPSETW